MEMELLVSIKYILLFSLFFYFVLSRHITLNIFCGLLNNKWEVILKCLLCFAYLMKYKKVEKSRFNIILRCKCGFRQKWTVVIAYITWENIRRWLLACFVLMYTCINNVCPEWLSIAIKILCHYHFQESILYLNLHR